MITNIEKYTDLLVRYKITANQYLLCYYLGYDEFMETHELLKYNASSNANRYQTYVEPWTTVDFRTLKEKGLIVDTNKPGEVKMTNYRLANDIKREIFIGKDEAFEELVSEYPLWLPTQDGKNLPARTGDFDKLPIVYGKIIGVSKENHKKIIDTIKLAKEHSLITMGIEKCIQSRQWEVWYSMIERFGLEEGVKRDGQFRSL
jgi:hypothetical protein